MPFHSMPNQTFHYRSHDTLQSDRAADNKRLENVHMLFQYHGQYGDCELAALYKEAASASTRNGDLDFMSISIFSSITTIYYII